MSENWHEMQHDFSDIDSTIRSLRFIESGDQLRFFSSEDLPGKWLEEPVWSMDADTKRLFIAGNEHGDILRFIEVYRAYVRPMLPLTIVNFDKHIDDAIYQKPDDAYASWQRYLYEESMTKVLNSYNITAVIGHKKGSNITQLLLASDFLQDAHRLQINVLSIDLDVYNDNLPGVTKAGDDVYRAIDITIKNSRCVMPFLSPVFTTHGYEAELMKDIFHKAIKNPIDPLVFMVKR